MKIKITVQNETNRLELSKTYQFNDFEYVSKPWEVILPDMIDMVSNAEEPFRIKEDENI